jgi:hypothetical protein
LFLLALGEVFGSSKAVRFAMKFCLVSAGIDCDSVLPICMNVGKPGLSIGDMLVWALMATYMEYIDAPNLGEKQVRRVSVSISRHGAYSCQMSKEKREHARNGPKMSSQTKPSTTRSTLSHPYQLTAWGFFGPHHDQLTRSTTCFSLL